MTTNNNTNKQLIGSHTEIKKLFTQLYTKTASDIIVSTKNPTQKNVIEATNKKLKNLVHENGAEANLINQYLDSKKNTNINARDYNGVDIVPTKTAYSYLREFTEKDGKYIKLKDSTLENQINDKIIGLSKFGDAISKAVDYENYIFIETPQDTSQPLLKVIVAHPILKNYIITGTTTYNGIILFTKPPASTTTNTSNNTNDTNKNEKKKLKTNAKEFVSYFNNIKGVNFSKNN